MNLANKLGVSVEWLENNSDVPVSSLDLIADMEAVYDRNCHPNLRNRFQISTDRRTTRLHQRFRSHDEGYLSMVVTR